MREEGKEGFIFGVCVVFGLKSEKEQWYPVVTPNQMVVIEE